MSNLSNPTNRVGVNAAVDLAQSRLIDYDGNYASGTSASKGITEFGQTANKQATLINAGTSSLELDVSVTVGQEIMAGTDGKGVVATNSSAFPLGTVVSAIALESGSAGGIIEVQIVNYKI